MSVLGFLLSKFWSVEVLYRYIDYKLSTNGKIKFVLKKLINQINSSKFHNNDDFSQCQSNDIFKYILSLGIEKGDILIVHSSMNGLKKVDISPNEIIDFLLNLVGDNGTLVFPAFPIINKHLSETIQTYNPKTTVSWTGLLPNIFCRYGGTIRSSFPYNSLAANGPHADKMMENNIYSDLPHGNNSSWEYCVNNHAKILYIGIHSENAFTIEHVAEDIMDNNWPINNWYENDVYYVKTLGELRTIPIRHMRFSQWFRFRRSNYAFSSLQSEKLIINNNIQKIPIDFIPDSKKLVDYLISEAKRGHILFYAIPKKYWKEEVLHQIRINKQNEKSMSNNNIKNSKM